MDAAGAQLGLDALGLDVVAPLVRVTPSRLASWTDCPRRYRLTYVDRPTPPRGGPRAHNTLGAVVHLALRSLLALPARDRTPRTAAALVDRNWSDEGFRDRAQAAGYRERARDWVADYAAELDPDAEYLGLERWLSVSTSRMVAEGRVDRLDGRDGEAVVVDYKTGRHALTVDDARDSAALAIYALAAARTLHRPCHRVELHHLPTGDVIGFTHDAASLARHVEQAEATAGALAEAAAGLAAGGDPDTLFPPRPSGRCGFCDVRRHCPEGRSAAPEREPWALLAP